MISPVRWINACIINSSVSRWISSYMGSRENLFRIRWISGKQLARPLRELEEYRVVPVFSEEETMPEQCLQAYQFHLSQSYNKKAKKITGIYSRALELALLRGLALSMGKEGEAAFRSMYTSSLQNSPEVRAVYRQMTDLDDRGLLRTVFLTEMRLLPSDGRDYTEELAGLLDYLRDSPDDRGYLNGKIRIGILQGRRTPPSDFQRIVCERLYRDGTYQEIAMERDPVGKGDFRRLLAAKNLREGETIRCRAVIVEPRVAVFDLEGLCGVLYREDLGWIPQDCRNRSFTPGEEYELCVKAIDRIRGRILLSQRSSMKYHLSLEEFPEIYSIVKVHTIREFHCYISGLYKGLFEVIIPKEEIFPENEALPEYIMNRDLSVLIYDIDKEKRIYGSIRKMQPSTLGG